MLRWEGEEEKRVEQKSMSRKMTYALKNEIMDYTHYFHKIQLRLHKFSAFQILIMYNE